MTPNSVAQFVMRSVDRRSKIARRGLAAAALGLLAVTAQPALAADVGVSVNIGEPGFFGHIDIGNAPRPQLIYAQPVVIAPSPVVVNQEPVYLHVPPGHARNWRRYCGRYNACGERVYFVQDTWYNKVYVPAYREHGHGHDDHDRGRGHDEGRHDDRRDDDHRH